MVARRSRRFGIDRHAAYGVNCLSVRFAHLSAICLVILRLLSVLCHIPLYGILFRAKSQGITKRRHLIFWQADIALCFCPLADFDSFVIRSDLLTTDTRVTAWHDSGPALSQYSGFDCRSTVSCRQQHCQLLQRSLIPLLRKPHLADLPLTSNGSKSCGRYQPLHL